MKPSQNKETGSYQKGFQPSRVGSAPQQAPYGQPAVTARPFFPTAHPDFAPPARTGSAPPSDGAHYPHAHTGFMPAKASYYTPQSYPTFIPSDMMYGPPMGVMPPQMMPPAQAPMPAAPAPKREKKIIAITNPTTGEVVVPGEVIASTTTTTTAKGSPVIAPKPAETLPAKISFGTVDGSSQSSTTSTAPTGTQESSTQETTATATTPAVETPLEKAPTADVTMEDSQPTEPAAATTATTTAEEKKSEEVTPSEPEPMTVDSAPSAPEQKPEETAPATEETSVQPPKPSMDIEITSPITSPISPTGGFPSMSPRTKLAYDKNTLLKLRPSGVAPPEALMNTFSEIFQKSTRVSMGTRMQNIPGLQPGERAQEWRGQGGFARGGMGRGDRGGKRRQAAPPPPPAPPVARGENAYVPSFIKPQADTTAKDAALKKLKGILNKLTPENYEKLREQVSAIEIPDADVLTAIIQLVFEKAVAEQHFSKMYATLCKDIATRVPTFPSEGGQEKSFKRLLLNRCQQEFERTDAKPANFDELTKDDQAELDFKIRRRMTGNVKFIGELFKEKMLSEKIMHEVIKRLLLGEKQTPSEMYIPPTEEIEVLCKFLSTVGGLLDHPKAKEYMNWYFGRMKDLSKRDDLPSRIRFMLLDAIDLRSNQWVPRRKEAEAKTLEQIHKEAEMEEQQKSAPRPTLAPVRTVTRLTPLQTQPSPPSTPVQTKPTEKAQPADDWSVQKKGRGKKGGKDQKEEERPSQKAEKGEKPKQKGAVNAFDLLMAEEEQPVQRPQKSKKQAEQQADIEVSLRPGGKGQQQQAGAAAPKPVLKSVPSNLSEIESEPCSPEPTDLQEELDIKVFTHKLLEDFFVEQDYEDYVGRVQKHLHSHEHRKEFVHESVTYVLEKDPREHKLVSGLFAEIRKAGVIGQDVFEEGFSEVLNFVLENDLATDLPFVFKLLGTFMGRAVYSSCIHLSTLESLADTYITNSEAPLDKRQALELIASAILTIKTEKGEDAVRQLLASSTFNVLRLFPPTDRHLDTFVHMFTDKGLIDFDASWHVFAQLRQAAAVDQALIDKILLWIGSNVDDATRSNPNVACRVLVAILNHVTRELPVRPDESALAPVSAQLTVLAPILLRFLTDNQKSQLVVLYDAHWFCWRCNAKGLVSTVFKNLYDNELVTEDVFWDWKEEKTKMPEDELPYQGHNEAVAELAPWFEFLKNAPEED